MCIFTQVESSGTVNHELVASPETKTNISRNRNVPHDLMLDILSRLPVRSLVRFRCAKRHWNSLFHDPYFVSLQLNHGAKNHTTYFCHYLIDQDRQFSVYPFKVEEGEVVVPYSKFTMPVRPSNLYILSNACNGLIAVYDYGVVCVVNPSTREWMSPPKMTPHRVLMRLDGEQSVGFGFCKSSGKYKLVHIFCRDKVHWGSEVLTLGTDRSWRWLGDAPCSFATRFKPTYVNGFIYWKIDAKDPGEILSFDVCREEFSTTAIQLPRFHPDPCAVYRHFFPTTFQGSLCLVDWRLYLDDKKLFYLPVMHVHELMEDSVWKERWSMRLSGMESYIGTGFIWSLEARSMFPVALQEGKVIIHNPKNNWKLQDLRTDTCSDLILPHFEGYDFNIRRHAKPFSCADTIVPIDWLTTPKEAAWLIG